MRVLTSFGVLAVLLLWYGCQGTTSTAASPRLVDPCEGCEAVFEWGAKSLHPVDTLPGWDTAAQKLHLSGTVYQRDGKTPAAGVVLYLYHTNGRGVYQTTGTEKGWARRHGQLRGWVKTGNDGRYEIYTQRPGIYPTRSAPAHIHVTVLEPDGKYYWIEDFYFAGDSLLTQKELKPAAPRGGNSGVVNLRLQEGLFTASRDIVLGMNIPGYE